MKSGPFFFEKNYTITSEQTKIHTVIRYREYYPRQVVPLTSDALISNNASVYPTDRRPTPHAPEFLAAGIRHRRKTNAHFPRVITIGESLLPPADNLKRTSRGKARSSFPPPHHRPATSPNAASLISSLLSPFRQ